MMYAVPNIIDDTTPMGALIHHPIQGLSLKKKMDAAGIECVVVYPQGPQPPINDVEFLVDHLTIGRVDRPSVAAGWGNLRDDPPHGVADAGQSVARWSAEAPGASLRVATAHGCHVFRQYTHMW